MGNDKKLIWKDKFRSNNKKFRTTARYGKLKIWRFKSTYG